jgi:uncharacterized protein
MPTRDTPWPDGTPCWIDYGASDMDAAQAFYARLFGWQFTEGREDFGGYVNALLDGSQVAGMGPLQDPADSPAWTTYFATGDIGAHVQRLTGAGGSVVFPPMEVGPMGTMTIARDPQGTSFGLWQAGSHTGVQRFNEHGSLYWNEAAVDDPAAARDFYSAVFGFVWDEVPGAGGYMTFRSEDRPPEHPLGGLGGLAPEAPSGWQTCFAVTSADEAVTAVGSAGGTVLTPPLDTPFGRFAVVRDPWGAPFEVMQTQG